MRKSRRPIIIASRRSRLARAQAEAVGRALERLHPQVQVRFRWIESEGDQNQTAPLGPEGFKGAFTRRVEQALLAGQADVAVHSLKDLPTRPTPGLTLAAIPRRGPVRDCLIAPRAATLEDLPQGATVGTSGPRRAAQLLRWRPDLTIVPIRGNVETRLRKVMEEGQADATLLAMAGLQRSGLGEHAVHPLDTAVMLPAAAQGALAIQCRIDDHVTLSRCLPLNDPTTATAVHLERTVVDALEGDCHSAVAALASPLEPAGHAFSLRALVLNADGRAWVEVKREAQGRGVDKLGQLVAQQLMEQGAREILHGQPAAARQTG